MAKITDKRKIFIRDTTIELMNFLKERGFNNQIIGEVFNRRRDYVKRILDSRKPKARSG